MDFMQMLQQMFNGGKTMTSADMDWANMGKANQAVLNNGLSNGTFTLPENFNATSNTLNDDLGWNMGTAKLGLGAISSLGSLWGAYNQNKLANAQFDFSKQMANANLNNQIKSYNTALTDRANTRAVMEGRDQNWADQYVNQNRLVK